ncbi:MAG: HEAT repeat domain-containing protein [Elusimicrobia bacterium]|nr:HEAT repeat domain-containing protein [Elusimicrobiota bacterium]
MMKTQAAAMAAVPKLFKIQNSGVYLSGPGGFNYPDILKYLDDQDPSIRVAAAKALKPYVHYSEVRHKLMALAENRAELYSTRAQAIKTLSLALEFDGSRFGSGKVRERIFKMSFSNNAPEDINIRALAAKALFDLKDQKTWEEIIAAAKSPDYPLEVRKAATWALFGAFGGPAHNMARQALLDLAADKDYPVFLRMEALKSLFSWMVFFDVYPKVVKLAGDHSEDDRLRLIAFLALRPVSHFDDVHRFLVQTADTDSDDPDQLFFRWAAITALNPHLDLETARFFHLRAYGATAIDPLEPE